MRLVNLISVCQHRRQRCVSPLPATSSSYPRGQPSKCALPRQQSGVSTETRVTRRRASSLAGGQVRSCLERPKRKLCGSTRGLQKNRKKREKSAETEAQLLFRRHRCCTQQSRKSRGRCSTGLAVSELGARRDCPLFPQLRKGKGTSIP